MKKSNFIVDFESRNGKYYMLHTGNGNVISVDIDKKILLTDVLKVPITNERVSKRLEELGFLISKQLDEFQVATGKKILSDIKNNYLELIIMPTEKCNFRCVYCYENFEKPEMSEENQNALIEFVKRQLPNHKGLSIGWFGGEPLLAVGVIERLSKAFIDLCKKYKKPYRAGITTNGYLLSRNMFDRLTRLRVTHFQITVDKQRVMAGGGGTFDTIIQNIKDIRDYSQSKLWTMSLRTNITRNIINNRDAFKRDVILPFSHDHRFYIMLRQMWTNHTEEADAIHCSNALFEEFVEQCDIGYESLYQEYVFSYGSHFTCYAANPNAFVIGSDGTFYKCTCALYDDVNHIGKIDSNGHIDFDENKFSYWIAPKAYNNTECLSCSQYAACVSKGCPYKQKEACNQETLNVLRCYIPQFYHLANDKEDFTDLL